jgi:hypothetical protein
MIVECVLIFLAACCLLFLGMPLRANVYDEGIVLTNAMRVATGQVPHRDFYANYGPAQFYIIAGLFKGFRESILVERLYDLFVRGLLVAVVYAVASRYCRRSVAICTAIATLVWLYGLYGTAGFATVPVALLNLLAASLIVPVFVRDVSFWRMLAVGCLAGAATLFRYDTGIALLGVVACTIAIAVSLRSKGERLWLAVQIFGSSLLGFALIVLPAAVRYLLIAPSSAFVHDIILYPGKYYSRARALPFPAVNLIHLDNLEIYLIIAVIISSIYAAIVSYLRIRRQAKPSPHSESSERQWLGFFLTFTLLVFAMYCKAFVRITVIHLFLAIIPSLLLLAGLFERRQIFPLPARAAIVFLLTLSLLPAVSRGLAMHWDDPSVESRLMAFIRRRKMPELEAEWCKSATTLTIGPCFLPDDDHARTDDHIRAIEFIDSHTTQNQKLFLGLPKHDRVFANDNLSYFAAQRLPATKWSHFDPDLQNRYDVQLEIVRELETTAPPYIVLDSEFDKTNEPNDSSRSSGVTLLDDYIHSRYRHVQSYGALAIWQRTSTDDVQTMPH